MASSDRYGPCYTAERACENLGGISPSDLDRLVSAHRLLRVTTTDGVSLYPAFQFADGSVMAGLPSLLETLLGSGADPWTVAHWLTARTENTDGLTAIEVLASDSDELRADLIRLARHDAAGWADSS